jgi:hypothetical protein
MIGFRGKLLFLSAVTRGIGPGWSVMVGAESVDRLKQIDEAASSN